MYRDRVIKHVFSQKSVSVFIRLPNKIRKVGAKMAPKINFFLFLKRSLYVVFFDFLTPCNLLRVVWPTPWGCFCRKYAKFWCRQFPDVGVSFPCSCFTENSRVASTFFPPDACRQTISEQPRVSWKLHSVTKKGAQFRICWRITA